MPWPRDGEVHGQDLALSEPDVRAVNDQHHLVGVVLVHEIAVLRHVHVHVVVCDHGESEDADVRRFGSHVRDLDRGGIVADAPGFAWVGDLEKRAQPDGVVSDRFGAAADAGHGHDDEHQESVDRDVFEQGGLGLHCSCRPFAQLSACCCRFATEASTTN